VEKRYNWNGAPFGPREVGYVYSYLGLLGIFIQGYVLGRLVKRWGESRTATVGLFLQGIGYGAFSFVSGIPGLLTAATIGSAGSGIVRPAITAALSRSAKPEEQGAILGVSQSLASIASVLAPLIAGSLIDYFSLTSWALISGGFALMGIFWRNNPVKSVSS
jgi:DHA1 family tetracycline resistance protein-like MFS transporter